MGNRRLRKQGKHPLTTKHPDFATITDPARPQRYNAASCLPRLSTAAVSPRHARILNGPESRSRRIPARNLCRDQSRGLAGFTNKRSTAAGVLRRQGSDARWRRKPPNAETF